MASLSGDTPYASALAAYGASSTVRLNVPGHGADEVASPRLAEFFGTDLLRIDVPPLLPGLDKGTANPLEQAHRLAARAWSARRTWFLTNGASQANRMVCLALAGFRNPTEKVIVQRSAHSSVIDGLVLGGLRPVFVSPSVDRSQGIAHGVSVERLREALDQHKDVKAVYLTSPSYFGAVADISNLAKVTRDAGVPLVVDAAWGAHFGFHPELPDNPIRQGADLVISSTHKLGGSLTQSAMLHLGGGSFADELEPLLSRAFGLTQSTSESSLLLASLDLARAHLEQGSDAIQTSMTLAEEMRTGVRARGRFRIASDGFDRFDDIVDVDPLRVSIDVAAGGLSGNRVRDELMRWGIYLEIATQTCVVAIVAPGRHLDVDHVINALHSLPLDGIEVARVPELPRAGRLAVTPRNAFLAPSHSVAAEDSVGRVSAETLAAYPPGIPNVLPGEVLTSEVITFLQEVAKAPGGYVRGAADATLRTFRVID